MSARETRLEGLLFDLLMALDGTRQTGALVERKKLRKRDQEALKKLDGAIDEAVDEVAELIWQARQDGRCHR